MSGHLRVWLAPDGHGSGRLFVEFEANGFSGRGSAYFDLADLESKAANFGRYPLCDQSPALIEGGYFTSDMKQLRQEHLHISALPIDARGGVALRVRGSLPQEEWEQYSPHFSSSIDLTVSYELLARFSADLVLLIQSTLNEIVVQSDDQA